MALVFDRLVLIHFEFRLNLPDLHPVEEDESLRNAAKDEARQARTLHAPRSSRSQAGTTAADKRRAS